MIIGCVKWVYFLVCQICGRLAYTAESFTMRARRSLISGWLIWYENRMV